MARKFPEVSDIFYQHLAACNTSRIVKNFMNLNNILALGWPEIFPNLNSIEYFRSIIKLRLRRKDCTTMVKLIEAITDCWYCDP